MNTNEYLDAVKQRHGLKSDYKLAKLLNWSHTRVSNYRNRGGQMDDAACLAVATALGVNPLEVIADIHVIREEDDAVKAFWREAAKLARAGFLAGFVFFMGSMSYAPPAAADVPQSVYYGKSRRRLRKSTRAAGFHRQRDLFPKVGHA